MYDGKPIRRVVIAVVIVTSLFVVRPAAPADATWLALDSPRFDVLSANNEKNTLAWSEEFNQFLDALGKVVTIDERTLPHLTVIMFRSDRDFKPYKPLDTKGKVDNTVAGFFSKSGSYSSIGLSTGYAHEETRRVIYHEAVHWSASGIKEPLPLWFEEGLAEVFSTFHTKRKDVVWGDVIVNYLHLLKESSLMDLEDLLAVRNGDDLFDDDRKASLFYAQSWLLVHYVMFGVYEGSRTGLTDYIVKSQTRTREAAFQEAFGMDYQAMERMLDQYRRSGKYFHHQSPKTASSLDPAFYTAATDIFHAKLAKFAHATGRIEQLKLHADALAALHPESALNFDVQALHAAATGSPDQLIAAAERAIELGTKDARTYMLLAEEVERQAAKAPDSLAPLKRLAPDQARRIVDLCHRAIELYPVYLEAYRVMAWALLNVQEVTSEDAEVFRVGVRRFPDEPELKLGLAIVERKNGKLEHALQLVREEAWRLGGKSDSMKGMIHIIDDVWMMEDYMKGMARIIDDVWMMEDYLPRIIAAVDAHQFDEANRLLDELDAYDFERSYKSMLRHNRQGVAIYEQIHGAEVAIKEKRREDARTILKKIKTMDGMTPLFRRQVDRMIEYYKLADGE